LPSNQEIIEGSGSQEDPNNNSSNKEELWAEGPQMRELEVHKDLDRDQAREEEHNNKIKKINPSEIQQATPSPHM
jgi:hypothetical protein